MHCICHFFQWFLKPTGKKAEPTNSFETVPWLLQLTQKCIESTGRSHYYLYIATVYFFVHNTMFLVICRVFSCQLCKWRFINKTTSVSICGEAKRQGAFFCSHEVCKMNEDVHLQRIYFCDVYDKMRSIYFRVYMTFCYLYPSVSFLLII